MAREILAADGPVAKALVQGGIAPEHRPQQGDMAAAVEAALAGRGRLLTEAGTGVGKSFAYLVPAMLRCVTTSERVVVATHTIALQEQLVKKDVPLLAATVGQWGLDPSTLRALTPALVKGRGNYLSIRRLKLASERSGRLFVDPASRTSLRVIEDWAYATTDGSLATLPPIERLSVWDRVRSDADNCMGRKCPHFESCFYQRSRRVMEAANLLICNHAVFFADLSMRASGLPGFLPEYQHVILDEAHNAEDVACEHFGLGLTEARVEHLLGVLHHARTGKGYLSHLASLPGLTESADAAAHATLRALDASRAFFDAILHAARSRDPAILRSGRVTRPGLVENVLSPAMKHLAGRLRLLREQIKHEPDRLELNAYAIRADAIAFDADALIGHKREGYVYWLETGLPTSGRDDADDTAEPDPDAQEQPERVSFPRNFRGRTRIKLACSPIDVAPALREHLWNEDISVVLTSATMATVGGAHPRSPGSDEPAPRQPEQHDSDADAADDDPEAPATPLVSPAFAHLAGQLGCDRARTLQVGSPFDYARQAEVIIDTGVPDPRTGPARAAGGSLDAYHRALADRVLHHIRQTDGGAFVLFTSFAAIRAVAAIVEPLLQRDGLPVLVQGRDGPAGRLVEQFRRDERSVLLGAASLWQGVDVRGRSLRNVIIAKLPFDPPDRPLVEARGERLRAAGRNPFAEDALPRAILRFRQGFGRLIRSRDDHGRVVILDARVVNTGYGRRFLDALPAGVEPRVESARSGPAADPDRHWIPVEFE